MLAVAVGLKATGQINGSKSIKSLKYKLAILGWERPLAADCWRLGSFSSRWVTFSVASYRLPIFYTAFFPVGLVAHDDERAGAVLDPGLGLLSFASIASRI